MLIVAVYASDLCLGWLDFLTDMRKRELDPMFATVDMIVNMQPIARCTCSSLIHLYSDTFQCKYTYCVSCSSTTYKLKLQSQQGVSAVQYSL